MSIIDLPERLLQRAAHAVLADPSRSFTTTKSEEIQIIAAGLLNPHEGPDFLDVAVLYDGVVHIGDAEFHKRTSDWHAHSHSTDPRYASLLLHVVMEDDAENVEARWTIVVSPRDLRAALRTARLRLTASDIAVDELQHFALLRLLRLTSEAQASIRRLGIEATLKGMAVAWLDRLERKRHRPFDDNITKSVREKITSSSFCALIQAFPTVASADVLTALEYAERSRVGLEGQGLRRELLLNAVLPTLCAVADHAQRTHLLQWFWAAKSLHPYGMLLRRFPNQRQDYIWQQQGMLEYLRHHGRRTSSCGEAIRAYGLAKTVEFLDANLSW